MPVSLNLYRGFNVNDPYTPPNMPAFACNLQAELRHHVRHGRFGRNTGLHWTNVLLASPALDIRSAWNSHRNAFNAANGDTVMVPDYPIQGHCTAFLVVMVQRVRAGQTSGTRIFDYLPGAVYNRCYLDRARPRFAACPDCPGVAPPSGVQTDCCANLIPLNLTLSWSGTGACACYSGSTALVYQAGPLGATWLMPGVFPQAPSGCGNFFQNILLECRTGSSACGHFRMVVHNSACGLVLDSGAAGCSCLPFSLSFVAPSGPCCAPGVGNQLLFTVTP